MHPSHPQDPCYPIGRFTRNQQPPTDHAVAVKEIAELPDRLRASLDNLTSTQVDTPYRDGGWTLRQLAHHVADSHMNACTRLRLALTEDWPTIKPYKEALWAELQDARTLPPDTSLALLQPLHERWSALLASLDEPAWAERGYTHPESGRTSIGEMTSLYSWHGRHHTAQVLALRARMGW